MLERSYLLSTHARHIRASAFLRLHTRAACFVGAITLARLLFWWRNGPWLTAPVMVFLRKALQYGFCSREKSDSLLGTSPRTIIWRFLMSQVYHHERSSQLSRNSEEESSISLPTSGPCYQLSCFTGLSACDTHFQDKLARLS